MTKHIAIAFFALLLFPAAGVMSIAAPTTIARPHATYAPKPEYPSQARARGMKGDGVFILRVQIQIQTGLVKDVMVAHSTGWSILDSAAVSTLKQWRFTPGTAHLSPIKVQFPKLKDAFAAEDSFVKMPVHFVMGR
jgi:TonB family protein